MSNRIYQTVSDTAVSQRDHVSFISCDGGVHRSRIAPGPCGESCDFSMHWDVGGVFVNTMSKYRLKMLCLAVVTAYRELEFCGGVMSAELIVIKARMGSFNSPRVSHRRKGLWSDERADIASTSMVQITFLTISISRTFGQWLCRYRLWVSVRCVSLSA